MVRWCWWWCDATGAAGGALLVLMRWWCWVLIVVLLVEVLAVHWCNGKFQQNAMNYERATWNSILSLLKEERMCTASSHLVSKKVLKERLKSFNLAFEEAYKTQTAWLIPDFRLREDLRISASLKVIQAYRTFMGRYEGTLDSRNTEKYIKYNAEDLENFILDLFEGSPRSLPNSRRR